VLEGVGPDEEDFRRGFDGNGNLLNLQPGQTLRWDLRNQLCEVRPVECDSEHYVYGADGMRVRKVRSMQTTARTLISEVRYLPSLELRTHSGTGEVLQVISVQAGRSSVRVLHWESVPPKDGANDQYRYGLNDHLGSCSLELDDEGEVISQECYHPFGTTAWMAGRGEIEASHKTVRYSGKERDATGLYYYGFRYYVGWWQRWLNPDPAGIQDGLNVFAFVTGNPLSFKDDQGLGRIDINKLTPRLRQEINLGGAKSVPIENLHLYGAVKYEARRSTKKVSDNTYKSLKQAHITNLMVKRLIPKGSGNQVPDIMRAEENLMSLVVEMQGKYNSGGNVDVILEYGAGNCGEHADIAFNLLASAETKEPVFRVAASGFDHGFVVIGDKRELSEDKLVVVDPWPIFPLAHTARDGAFKIGIDVRSAPAKGDPKYAIDDDWLDRHSGLRFWNAKEGTDSAREKYDLAVSQEGNYSQLFSRKKGHEMVDYQSKKGEVGGFYSLPKSYVENRMTYFRYYR
jgi:RHS repeat-associated protein